jgi:hypothetical protein
MKLGFGEVEKTYSYLENGCGVDLFKVQIKNPILHPIIVAFTNNKAILLLTIFLLRKTYGM